MSQLDSLRDALSELQEEIDRFEMSRPGVSFMSGTTFIERLNKIILELQMLQNLPEIKSMAYKQSIQESLSNAYHLEIRLKKQPTQKPSPPPRHPLELKDLYKKYQESSSTLIISEVKFLEIMTNAIKIVQNYYEGNPPIMYLCKDSRGPYIAMMPRK